MLFDFLLFNIKSYVTFKRNIQLKGKINYCYIKCIYSFDIIYLYYYNKVLELLKSHLYKQI